MIQIDIIMKWYIILIIAVAAIALLIYFSVPAIIYKAVFGVRYNKNPRLNYFSAEDFELDKKDVETFYDGKTLHGCLYSVKPISECDKLIIFQHGIGAGQCAYTTEISALAKAGFAVLAFDAYGCGLSDGKSIKGFYAGAECVVSAYLYAKSDQSLKNKPVYLLGHSWGAYSVLCATELIAVEGVVAISAPDKPSKLLSDMLKCGIFRPVFSLYNLFACGKNGNRSAVKALKNSGSRALLIHGANDNVVPPSSAAANLASGENVTVYVDDEKFHNPYNTVNAEKLLAELNKAITKKEQPEFFENFDFKAATEQDEKVITKIIRFISE